VEVGSCPAAPASSQLSEDERNRLQSELAGVNRQLLEVQGESPLMQVVVDAQTVGEVIAGGPAFPSADERRSFRDRIV